jgi:L-lactate utilization protein LutC
MTIDEFLNRLVVLYGPPESPDVAAFVNEYREMLRGTGEHLLKPAGDEIRATHTRRGWPTPAEVKAAIGKAAAKIQAKPVLAIEDHSAQPTGKRMSDKSREALMVQFRSAMAEFELKNVIKRAPLDASREAFQAMQRNSPNHKLHRAQPGEAGEYHQTSNEAMAAAIADADRTMHERGGRR